MILFIARYARYLLGRVLSSRTNHNPRAFAVWMLQAGVKGVLLFMAASSLAGSFVIPTDSPGWTVTATVTPGVDTLINGRSMDFRGTVFYSGDNGSASASFSSTIYVYKELVLSMSSPSSSIIDMYLFRPEGFKGSIWPSTAAVNGGAKLFEDDKDRLYLLGRLEEAGERHGVRMYLFCLMQNHFHLVLETPRGNLGRYMQGVLTGCELQLFR